MKQVRLDAARGDGCVELDLPDAEVIYYPRLFGEAEANQLFAKLMAETDWREESIKMYGKPIPLPRLTAWCSDPGKVYTYSGIRLTASPWTNALREVKTRIEKVSGAKFNSVLLNRYRDGNDSVAWHSDDEKELGQNPVIGSVSFGAPREFQMRHKTAKQPNGKPIAEKIMLAHGSYLLMRGATQHHWAHQIAKTKQPTAERINLTFRHIKHPEVMENRV